MRKSHCDMQKAHGSKSFVAGEKKKKTNKVVQHEAFM